MKKIMIAVLSVLVIAIGGLIAVQNFFSQQTQEAGPIYTEETENVTYEYDVSYKKPGINDCKMDIAYHADEEKKPLVAIVHGGFWITGDKKSFSEFFYTFAGRGYTVANINYDLVSFDKDKLGKVSILDQINEVDDAIGFLIDHADKYGIDTEQIYIIGHSAGGQLVGRMIEITEHSIKGAVLMSAASDFRYMLYNTTGVEDEIVSPVLIPFMFDGEIQNDVITAIDKVDVLANVHKDIPPVLIIHGDFDELLPYTLSQALFKKMNQVEADARLEIVHGMKHNPEIEEVADIIDDFLKAEKEVS